MGGQWQCSDSTDGNKILIITIQATKCLAIFSFGRNFLTARVFLIEIIILQLLVYLLSCKSFNYHIMSHMEYTLYK